MLLCLLFKAEHNRDLTGFLSSSSTKLYNLNHLCQPKLFILCFQTAIGRKAICSASNVRGAPSMGQGPSWVPETL